MAEWSREAVEILIDSYRKYEILYNSKLTGYQNKHQRTTALNEIAENVKQVRPFTSSEDIKKKMLSLRTHYGQELQKTRMKKSGSGTDSMYVPSVWWFSQLSFLKDYMQCRKGENSLSTSSPRTFVCPTNAETTFLSIPYTVENDETQIRSESLLSNYNPIPVEVLEVAQEEVIETEEEASVGFVGSCDNQSRSSVSTPSSSGPKRKKTRHDDSAPLLDKAQGILDSLSSRLTNNAGKCDDSPNKDFGKFVAHEFSQIKSNKIALLAKQKILSVLMEARIEDSEIF